MINHLGRLIADYGYLIVATFIFCEGIAIPFPTDSTLVTASAFAAHGRLSLAIVFLVSTITATAGTTVAFVLGR
ncbi:MAG: DedA family protein, partial [Gemmatimonadaceae bacterium]